MFKRLDSNLPRDPRPTTVTAADSANANITLASLGFVTNEDRRFIKADTAPGQGPEYFTFFQTDNERANEVHREAVHAAIKNEMLSELKKLGISEVFITKDSFQVTKPLCAHVTILASEPTELKKKRNVIVITNEAKQDLGVLAYRSLTRDGGLDRGSVVGLARKLCNIPPDLPAGITAEDLQALKTAIAELRMDGTTNGNDGFGLIVLNPGELLYSYKLNATMSQSAWLARPKASALAAPYEIREANYLPGHESPEAHIRTIFGKHIPALVDKDARLYVIGMSDGGESVLKYMDEKLGKNINSKVPGMIKSIALTEPTHNLATLSCKFFANFLAQGGAKSYVLSEEPKGSLLKMPQLEKSPPLGSAKFQAASILSSAEKNALARRKSVLAEQDEEAAAYGDRFGSATATSPPIKIPSIYGRKRQPLGLSDSAASRRSFMEKISTNTTNPFFPEKKGISPEPSVTGDVYTEREEYHEEQELMMQTSYPDLRAILAKQKNDWGETTDDGSGKASSNMSQAGSMPSQTGTANSERGATEGEDGPNKNQEVAIKGEDGSAEENANEFGDFDYGKVPVSCLTYSSGVADIAEMILPNVLEDVLEWFKEVKRDAEEKEAWK